LLDAGVDGVALTQTNALSRAVVREAAERFPSWWDAELFCPPHREDDLAVLGALHDGLKRLRLMHRRGRRLLTTKRGRALSADPEGLGLRRPACRRSRGLRPAGRRTAQALTTLHDAI
jgi:hypothetical protein